MALIRLKTRGIGVLLVAVGVMFLLGYWLAPVPDFDELERREGIVEDAHSERIRFCRNSSSDCLHTVVDVRHADGLRSYNFAQAAVGDVVTGEDIVLWVAPSIRGLDDDRVWQAEQGGRRVRDYESQARADRWIIWIMVPLGPLLIFSGYRLARCYDWSGNPKSDGGAPHTG